ncbi:branched-chain amino acid transport system ATP-binding protein [Cryobacterium flavum]|uniref:ABC transporter ATP-binding protein n=1 Tax=Cryobacterium flavum TaxID=1424659 RepID=A0A4R8V7N9_9MICO|nr:ABC transporter ATP-binding protein [Cryobacterium flavum]TFB77974.1 ABC transporter ATP-binding protein [Cryobacterium flavum]SDO23974.1 branched-chain amino acid transport system ATP-binding protein [Cryobacterium flavum]
MSALLEVKDLHAGYGASRIVRGVSLSVEEGAGIVLFGRNGVGKSTFMQALMGMVTPSSGQVLLAGKQLAGRPAHEIAKAGLAIVPQGRRLFPDLTVQENLMLGIRQTPKGWTLDTLYELLPRLAERTAQPAGLLSGGEQQMVAIGRALLRNPSVLLLDEPSEGLAPRIIAELAGVLRTLRADGLTVLIVEQNLKLGLTMSDHVAIMDVGKIVHESTVTEFRRSPDIARRYLGVI